MRKPSATWSFLFSTTVVVGFFVACGGGDARPKPGDGFVEGGSGADAPVGDTAPPVDAADAADAEPDSGLCKNAKKDGTETDTDCGGSDGCARCALTRACEKATDCAPGADCLKKFCALCTDGTKNGDETDIDCGGKSCGGCKVGKSCKAGADCRSETCSGGTCACPTNMAIVTTAAGGSYCIDQEEVSKGQYFKFVTGGVDVNTQTGACLASNATFVPRGAWPPAPAPATLAFSMGLPVHYVDWCDATAYCKWASKELCGSIGGGTLPPADAANAAKGAWYNACSAQGVRVYPYGDVFDPAKCNNSGIGSGVEGPGGARESGFGYLTNLDENIYDVVVSDGSGNIASQVHTACLGGAVGVFQMSGNVAEWEDSCDGTTAASNCALRGGSYASASSAEQTCASVRNLPRMPAVTVPDPLKDVGFRCCQY